MNFIYTIISILIVTSIVVIVMIRNKKYPPQIVKKCDSVLAQLKANGDNHSLPRVVDHWIYFNSKGDVDNFIIEVKKIGFSLISEQVNKAKVYNYVVNIGRSESVVRREIIKTVSELDTIAKKYNGDYDGWGCMIQK